MSKIVARRVAYECPWFDVVVKDVELARGREEFWSIETRNDYAAVLAVTADGRVPLVRVFRPAVEDVVLELPSGAIDPGESPAEASRRELLEETGCQARELVELGKMHVDVGRSATWQWGFFAPSVEVVGDGPTGDEELDLTFVTPRDLRAAIREGRFRAALHVAVVALAEQRGMLPA